MGKAPEAIRLLDPVDPPIGLFTHFWRKEQKTVFSDKLLNITANSFIIRTSEGEELLKCDTKALSVKEMKPISDMNGNGLFAIRTKIVTFVQKQIVEDLAGRELFTVIKALDMKTRMLTTFQDIVSGLPVTLILVGDMFRYNAEISLESTGQVVATISRDFWSGGSGGWRKNKQTYYMTVAVGVDLALMAGFCLCVDALMHEGHGGSG